MAACRRLKARLTSYSENALSVHEAERIRQHLQTCPSCREELAMVRQMAALLRTHKPQAPEPASDLWSRIHQEVNAAPRVGRFAWWYGRWALPAGGLAAAALAVCLLVRPWHGLKPAAEPFVTAAPTVPQVLVPDAVSPKTRPAAKLNRVERSLGAAVAQNDAVRIASASLAKPARKPVVFVQAPLQSPRFKNLPEKQSVLVAIKPQDVLSLPETTGLEAASATVNGEIDNSVDVVVDQAQPAGSRLEGGFAAAVVVQASADWELVLSAQEVPATASAVEEALNAQRQHNLFRYVHR